MTLIAPRKPAGAPRRRRRRNRCAHALSEAFGHRSYVLLVLGFFTCGFQLAFVTVHLPSYLARPRTLGRGRRLDARDHRPVQHRRLARLRLARDLPAQALYPRRSSISRARSRSRPSSCCRRSPAATLIFGAVTGLLWLSTVPPTSGLVAVMFGTRWLTMLFGFAFFSHQVGGFLGVWLGGIVFERTGSYDIGLVALGRCSACSPPSSTCRSWRSRSNGLFRPRHNRHTSADAASARPPRNRIASWRTPADHRHLRLPDRDDQLRPALVVRLLHGADDGATTAGAATCSRCRSRCRRCSTAWCSRSPARSPTSSAPCA